MINMSNNYEGEGRAVENPIFRENKDGSKKVYLKLAIQRNFKNAEGKRDTDFIPFEGFIKAGAGNGVYDLIHKGDLIRISAELRSDSFEKDGVTQYRIVQRINGIELKESKSITDARLAKAEVAEATA